MATKKEETPVEEIKETKETGTKAEDQPWNKKKQTRGTNLILQKAVNLLQ